MAGACSIGAKGKAKARDGGLCLARPILAGTQFPSRPQAPDDGKPYNEDIKNIALSQKGIDAAGMYFKANVVQRHGQV